MRGATLFSGGRGADVNRVEDVDYSTWGALDYLHASPVCKEYSAAKTNGAEGEGDLSSAAAVVRCLDATQPRVFTLENVGAYQHGQAFRLIVQWLNHNGYIWHAEVLNAADFGVPQTRRRLILRAVRDALLPSLPPAQPWRGWFDAIRGKLRESQPTPYQLRRIGTTSGTAFVDTNNDSRAPTVRRMHAPAPTILSSWWRRRTPKGIWMHEGKIGHITPRNGAQLQSVPDWYQLPDDARLAGEIVGNMVPPLMMRNIVLPLI